MKNKYYTIILCMIFCLFLNTHSKSKKRRLNKTETLTMLKGKWKLIKIKSRLKYDLNSDGKKSNDIMSERINKCLNECTYEFQTDSLQIITGLISICEDNITNRFWSINFNNIFGIFVLKISKNKKFKKKKTNEFVILSITQNTLRISGEYNINSSRSSKAILTFTRN